MILYTFIALAFAQQHQGHAPAQQQNPWARYAQMGMLDMDFNSDAMQNMYDYQMYNSMFRDPHSRQGQGQGQQRQQGGFNPMMYAMMNNGDLFEQMADTAQDMAEMRAWNRLINPHGPPHGHRHGGVPHHLMKPHAQPGHGAQHGGQRRGGLSNLFNAYMMDYEGMESEDYAQAIAMGANPASLPPSEAAMDMIDNVVDYAMDTPYWAMASNMFGGRRQQGQGQGHGQGQGQQRQQQQNPWQQMFSYPGFWMGELSKPRPVKA
jgi:hypothetical protein